MIGRRSHGRLLVLVLAFVTGVAAADALVDAPWAMAFLFAVAPVLAAIRLPARLVGVVALYALALALLGAGPGALLGPLEGGVRGVAVVAGAALGLAAAHLRGRVDSTRGALEAVVRQMPQGILVVEAPSGRVLLQNERASAILRRDLDYDRVDDYVGSRVRHLDGRPYDTAEWPVVRSLVHGETVLGEEMRYAFGDGTEGTIEVSTTPVRDEHGRVLAVVAMLQDVSERRREEEDRAELLARERAARRAAEAEERRSAFLSKATTLLAASTDWEAALSGVAMTTVPEWADWCSFAVVGDGGEAQHVAIAHADPAKEMLGWELVRRWPTDRGGDGMAARVIRTGRAEIVAHVPESALEAAARDGDHLRVLRELGLASVMVVPMRVGGHTLGAMTFVLSDPERSFDTGDLQFAEELAARAALTVDNARRERAAREVEERFRLLVESVEDYAIFTLDPEGRVTSWNPGAERIMGHAAQDIVGRHVACLYPVDEGLTSASEGGLAEAERVGCHEEEGWLARADGVRFYANSVTRPLWDERGALRGFSRVTRDVTERKRLEAQLEHQAFHDALTGLPNRTLFLDRLAQALARSERRAGSVALLFLDLDRFKLVNDTLGHVAGDALLVDAAERLRACVREEDTVARLGGDEFVVICEELARREDGLVIAERIRRAFVQPFRVEEREVFAGASVGVAFARDGQTREALVQEADVAMYAAKERGDGHCVVFEDGMGEQGAAERLEKDAGLRRALERDELRLAYQPVVDLHSSAVVGVEALIRWQHPQRGLLRPAEFIGLAEETGLIGPIGEWVLGEACAQVARWSLDRPDSPPLVLTVAVNLSARQMAGDRLVDAVGEALARTGIDPSALCLEITESQLVTDADAARTLLALKGLGVRLAIDDFGTGYSSLAYLKRLPVHVVKLDGSFVDGLGRHADDRAIVSAMIGMAHALGLSVVAEGVETLVQAEELVALGCDLGQGYLWSEPLTATDLEALLAPRPARRRSAPPARALAQRLDGAR